MTIRQMSAEVPKHTPLSWDLSLPHSFIHSFIHQNFPGNFLSEKRDDGRKIGLLQKVCNASLNEPLYKILRSFFNSESKGIKEQRLWRQRKWVRNAITYSSLAVNWLS